MARYLNKLGVPQDKITTDEQGFNFASQVKRTKKLIADTAQLTAITLECHSQRAELLLRAHGFNPEMVTIESVFQNQPIPQALQKYFDIFLDGTVKAKLESESRLLLFLQSVDPKGYLQLLITRLRGIRYFDVDIPPTIARPTTSK